MSASSTPCAVSVPRRSRSAFYGQSSCGCLKRGPGAAGVDPVLIKLADWQKDPARHSSARCTDRRAGCAGGQGRRPCVTTGRASRWWPSSSPTPVMGVATPRRACCVSALDSRARSAPSGRESNRTCCSSWPAAASIPLTCRIPKTKPRRARRCTASPWPTQPAVPLSGVREARFVAAR